MGDPRARETSGRDSRLSLARSPRTTALQGLAVAVAVCALLGSAGCVGLTDTKPLAPGGGSTSSGAGGDTITISVNPLTIAFGDVAVGATDSQAVTISNKGDDSATITKVAPSGYGFIYTGLPTPITIGAGLSVTFTVSFKPASAGAASGAMTIESSATSYKVALSGTGVASAPQISANTAHLTFGSITVGTPLSLPVILQNTGNANLDISSVSASGSGFTASGGSGVTLAPNQSTTVTVTFDPKAAGSVTGGLAIASNASSSPSIVLSGTGVTASSSESSKHSVALTWSPSASAVLGYFVYRGTISGGPYSKLFASADTASSYKDASVSNGQTYYYVVTSIDPTDVESSYSNQVSVTIPSQ